MSRWFRVYDEAMSDPKVQKLAPHLFKAWFNLLCLANKTGNGILPSISDIAYHLRLSDTDAQTAVDELVLAGLIDITTDRKLAPHNWASRQAPSDSSKERTKKWRAGKTAKQEERHGDGDVTVGDCHGDGIDSDPDPEEEIDNNPYTCTGTAREGLGRVVNFASHGAGLGERVVSPEAKLTVCQKLNLRECDPLVFAFLEWKPSRKARNLDAMFVKSAPRIFGRMKPDEQKRMLIPPDPEFAPKPIKPSASLLAVLGKHNGR